MKCLTGTSRWCVCTIVCAAVMVLSACSGPSLNPMPPAGFDVSGQWQIVPDLSDSPPSMRDLRSRNMVMSFATQDFPVLMARGMVIEQNPDSMGVRYDTGDYRDVSWGKRTRGLWEIDAGWSDGRLYIISEAHDAKATEVIRLEDGGKTLVIVVDLEAGDNVTLTRVFERSSSTY